MTTATASWEDRVSAIGDFFENVEWLEEPRALYQSIADELVRLARCDTVSLRMLSVAGDEFIGCASSGSARSLVAESYSSLPASLGRMPELMQTRQPIVYDLAFPQEGDVRSDEGLALGYRHAVTAPLVFADEIVGVVDFIFREGQYDEASSLTWVRELCRVIGSIMGMIGVSDRMTELRIADEVRRVGIELHDSLAQPISVVSLEADKALMAFQEGDGESLNRNLVRMRDASHQALASVRQEMMALQDNVAESEDLAEIIDRFVSRFVSQWGLHVEFNGPGRPVVVTKKVGDQVLRILNEALGNALRHARASKVDVSLESGNGMISLQVEDDGCGFDVHEIPAEKMGIRIMRERVDKVGGRLSIASIPGEGTSLVADIPIAA